MTHLQSVSLLAQATFGRDGAMFEGLLGFVSQLSVVLWGVVLLTVVMRFVGIGLYRRGARRRAARMALVQAEAPSDAAPAAAVSTSSATVDLVQPSALQLTGVGQPADAATNATFDEALQPAEAPAAFAPSVPLPRPATRGWHAEPRSAAHLPALASNSTES